MSEIKLGDKVKDQITNYTGIAIGLTRWLSGCDRVTIQSQELKGGKPIDAWSCDVTHVTVVKAGVIKERSLEPKEKPGGPQRDPKPVH